MAEIQDVMDKLDEIETKIGEVETKIGENRDLWKPCPNCNPDGVDPPPVTNCQRCENGFIRVRILATGNPGA